MPVFAEITTDGDHSDRSDNPRPMTENPCVGSNPTSGTSNTLRCLYLPTPVTAALQVQTPDLY